MLPRTRREHIDEDELRITLDDMVALIANGGSVEGGPIKLSEPRYASGDTAQQVVDAFYDDVVTLGRLRSASLRR